MALIDEHLRDLVAKPRPRLLTVGLLVTLYSASRGVDAVAQGAEPGLRRQGVAPVLEDRGARVRHDDRRAPCWCWSRSRCWPPGAAPGSGWPSGWASPANTCSSGAGCAGRSRRWSSCCAPRWRTTCCRTSKQEFKFITPGSVIGTLRRGCSPPGASACTPANFGSYNVTYGSIGGVIVLLTWFYISGFIFLMGGEINAIIESASPDGKASGARAPGRGAAAPRRAPERRAGGRGGQGGQRRRRAPPAAFLPSAQEPAMSRARCGGGHGGC